MVRKMQYEDLNSKSQIPNNKQYPNSNFQNESSAQGIFFVLVIRSLEIGACLKFGACDLEF